jgi:hypothetical protein
MAWLGLIVEALVLVATIHYQLRGMALGLSALLGVPLYSPTMFTPALMVQHGHILEIRRTSYAMLLGTGVDLYFVLFMLFTKAQVEPQCQHLLELRLTTFPV